MADSRADILLTINSNLEGIRKAQEAFLSLKQNAQQTTDGISRMGSIFSSFGTELKNAALAGAGLGAGFTVGSLAAQKIVDAVRDVTNGISEAVKQGVKLNMSMETAKFGFAGVLKQFGGDSMSDFTGAMNASAKVVELLKQKSVQLGMSFPELAEQYRATVGAMYKGGITDLNKQVEMTVLLKRSMDALGISGFQAVRDTADILNGIAKRTMAGRMLQIEDADLKAASDAGKLYDYLQQKLNGISAAADAAMDSTESWEHRLENTKANVAAKETENLTASYKGLLQSINDMDQSPAYRRLLDFWANTKAGVQWVGTQLANAASGNSGTSVGAVSRAAFNVNSFKRQAEGVNSNEDVDKTIQAGLDLQFQLTASAKMRNASKETRDQLLAMADAVFAEVKALEKEGEQRIKNNALAAEQAKKESEARKLADESAKAREEGVKKYTEMQEKERTATLSAAKSDAATYLTLLQADKATFEKALKDPKASRDFYLKDSKAPTPELIDEAEKAAGAYRMEISAKLKTTEKEIAATQESQAKKAKTDADERQRAEVHYLQVKSQEGSLDDKLAALAAEKNALDKNAVDYKAQALAIDLRAAALKDQEAAKAAAYAAKLAKWNEEAAANRIRDNQFLTDREKREALYLAFKREEQGYDDEKGHHLSIDERVKAAEGLVKNSHGAMQAQAQTELDALKQRQLVGLPHDIAINRPQSMVEEITSALTALRSGFATVATSIAEVMSGTINSISGGLQGLLNGTMTVGQAARSVYVGIGQSITRAISDAAAQWIIKHTVMAAWSKLFAAQEVATHTGAEAAKTTATAVGAGSRGGIRLGETIFHNLQVAWRVTVHILGEIAKTAATAIQTALRIPMIIAESIGHVIKAGAGAMSAVASIPYVGPILAIAALAAVVAAGMAAVKGISKGWYTGGYTGPGGKYEEAGPAHKGEVIFSQEDVARHGGPAAVERLRLSSGVYKGSASGATAASQSKPVMGSGAGAGGGVNIAYFNTQQDAESWLRTQNGRRTMIDFNRREAVSMK
jgi:hypothetical protein